MIVIRYDRAHNLVTLRGHAGAGVMGQDIICAAVSALCYTLAANVRALKKEGAVRETVIKLSPGKAMIGCTPAKGREAQVQIVFTTLCLGLTTLAEGYPEYVTFHGGSAAGQCVR